MDLPVYTVYEAKAKAWAFTAVEWAKLHAFHVHKPMQNSGNKVDRNQRQGSITVWATR